MPNPYIEFMLEEYKTLREEIMQSIKTQYNITIAEATTIFGSFISLAAAEKYNIGKEFYSVFLCIPFILIIFTSLWIIEQSRMMRVGNYIQMLENKINKEGNGIYLFWENSLRLEPNTIFSRTLYLSQFINVFGFYFLGSMFSIWAIWKYGVASEEILTFATILYMLLSLYIAYLFIQISIPKSELIRDFLEKREKYNSDLARLKEYKNIKDED